METGNCIIIQNSHGKYLMQFRDDTPGINHPLTWCFFGGSSEADETPLQGAIRELQEELEIVVDTHDLEEIAMHALEAKPEYLYKFKHALDWGDFFVREGAGAAFLTKEELLQLPITKQVQLFFTVSVMFFWLRFMTDLFF